MKKLFPFLLLALLLSSCAPVVDPGDPINARVYDSAWRVVREATVKTGAKALDTADALQAEVDAYNASHTDDQYFLVEGDEVPIEEAPICNAWIVDKDDYTILTSYPDWPRADLAERREIWRFEALTQGGVVFVDRIPPAPEPPPVVTPYEKYSLYLVRPDGQIDAEEHYDTFDWQAAGATSLDAAFEQRRNMFATEALTRGPGWQCVSGRIYTPPEL